MTRGNGPLNLAGHPRTCGYARKPPSFLLPSSVLPSSSLAVPTQFGFVSRRNLCGFHTHCRVDVPVLLLLSSSSSILGKTTSGSAGLVSFLLVGVEPHKPHMEDTDTIRRSSDVYMFLNWPFLLFHLVQTALPRHSPRHTWRRVGTDKLCTAISSLLCVAAWHL